MGAERLRVYCADLTRAAQTATDAVTEIDGLRAKLGSQLDDLSRTWTGQAASAYLDVWAEINHECGEMLADLRWIGDSLSATATAFTDNEHTAAAALADIRPTAAPPERL